MSHTTLMHVLFTWNSCDQGMYNNGCVEQLFRHKKKPTVQSVKDQKKIKRDNRYLPNLWDPFSLLTSVGPIIWDHRNTQTEVEIAIDSVLRPRSCRTCGWAQTPFKCAIRWTDTTSNNAFDSDTIMNVILLVTNILITDVTFHLMQHLILKHQHF